VPGTSDGALNRWWVASCCARCRRRAATAVMVEYVVSSRGLAPRGWAALNRVSWTHGEHQRTPTFSLPRTLIARPLLPRASSRLLSRDSHPQPGPREEEEEEESWFRVLHASAKRLHPQSDVSVSGNRTDGAREPDESSMVSKSPSPGGQPARQAQEHTRLKLSERFWQERLALKQCEGCARVRRR
jgi:hypothetical protein